MDEMAQFRSMVRRGPWVGSDLNDVFASRASVDTEPSGVAQDLGVPPWAFQELVAGLQNGNFAEGPPDPTANLNDITNKLPGASFVQSSGTGVTAKWVSSAAAGSGGYILFTVAAGAAGDEAYLEWVQNVPSSYSQRFALSPFAYLGSYTGATGLDVFIECEFLDNSDTLTGTTGSFASSFGTAATEINVFPNSTGAAPSDARTAKVRIGVTRSAAATSATGTVRFYEVVSIPYPSDVWLGESTTPGTYGMSHIRQLSGVLILSSNHGGTGTNPALWLNGADGSISLYPRAVGVLVEGYPLTHKELSSTSTPAANYVQIYPKSDGKVYSKDDAGTETLLGFSGCRVHRTSTLAISDSTDTNLRFDTTSGATEDYDTDSYHANANPARMTVPADGYYHIDVGIEWEANSTGVRNLWLEVDGSGEYGRDRETTPSASAQEFLHVSADLYLTSGQYVQAKVRQTSGGSLNINSGNNSFLNIHRLG